MAQGSYTPLYIEPTLSIIGERILFAVLFTLASHANEYGTCYPSPRHIATVAKYADESVINAIRKLNEIGYVRHSAEYSETRRKWIVTHQISPLVIYVREELFDEAIAMWECTRTWDEIHTLINVPKPYNQRQQSKIQPEVKPELQPTTSPLTRKVKSNDGKSRTGDRNPNNSNHAKGVTTATAQSGYANHHATGDNHAVGDIKKTLSAAPDFRYILPYNDMEAVAQELRSIGPGTHIATARKLVYEYGIEKVKYAMKLAWGKQNPIGYVVTVLRSGGNL